jgi:hypothetical protein
MGVAHEVWLKRGVLLLKRTISALVGIALLAGAVWSSVMIGYFLAHAKTAQGVVVGLNAGGSHPQIEFITAEGQKVSFPQGGLIFGYRVGERVKVKYIPADPVTSVSLDAFGALWFAPALLAVLSGIFILVGRRRETAPGAKPNQPGKLVAGTFGE